MADQNPDIVWSGDAYICNKQLKHYPYETNIPVYSFMWILGGEGNEHLGHVEDLCEGQNGEKMVKSAIITLPQGNRGPNS
ncbi:hypothetical protein ABFX02_12G127750 [Erythranthe guttata]